MTALLGGAKRFLRDINHWKARIFTMTKLNPWKLSTLFFAGALAFTLASSSLPEAQAEKQPHMRAALSQLKAAKHQLKVSTHDKGGHRVKAMALTTQAIQQVEKGIAFDNRN